MRHIIGTICVFFIIFAAADIHCLEWQDETADLRGNEFYSIACGDDGNVYAGTGNGLYLKSRCGEEWRRIFSQSGQYKGVKYIEPVNKRLIYIATKNGFFGSENSGGNWKRLHRGIRKENYCTCIKLYPGKPDTIYIGTLEGVFWTEDRGKSWKRPTGTLGQEGVARIALMKTENRSFLFVISGNEVYKGPHDFSTYIRVFGGSFKEYAETELEEDEKEEAEEESTLLLNDIVVKDSRIYLATNRGLFVSRDSGVSWIRLSDEGLLDLWINRIVFDEKDRLFAATGKGVFLYSVGEESWKRISGGMQSVAVTDLDVSHGGAIWAMARNRIYRMDPDSPKAFLTGQDKDRDILSGFKGEPTINETMQMAIRYAEVYPEKIARWRRQAKFRALLPRMSFSIDRGWSDTYEIYTSSSTSYWISGPNDRTEGWDINFSWDLADLIWNPSQTSIDVRSKLMVQLRDDIVDEVNRTYFERRRLQVELLTDPPADLNTRLKKKLRLEELTASLDGYTGGDFSKGIEKKD